VSLAYDPTHGLRIFHHHHIERADNADGLAGFIAGVHPEDLCKYFCTLPNLLVKIFKHTEH
jgi:hypothetical protein